MNKRLLSILLTTAILLLVIGIGYLFYNFHSQSLSVLIGIIGLLFIKHIYVAVYHSLDDKV
jgi:hypothetical protein